MIIHNKDELKQIIIEKINTKNESDIVCFSLDGTWKINDKFNSIICIPITELIRNNTNNIYITLDYNLSIIEKELTQRQNYVDKYLKVTFNNVDDEIRNKFKEMLDVNISQDIVEYIKQSISSKNKSVEQAIKDFLIELIQLYNSDIYKTFNE